MKKLNIKNTTKKQKWLLGLGAATVVVVPIACIPLYLQHDDSGFKETSVDQTAALESLGAIVKDLPYVSSGLGKVVKTELDGDKVRFTVLKDPAETDPTKKVYVRATVDMKQKRITAVETKTGNAGFKDITNDLRIEINSEDITGEVINAQAGLKVASSEGSIKDFAVGRKFDDKAMKGLLLKAGITMPEVKDSGIAAIDEEQNMALEDLFNGNYVIKAFATGIKSGDTRHDSNDYAVLLEDSNMNIAQYTGSKLSTSGQITTVKDTYRANWGQDFSNQIGKSGKDQFILYVQDSTTNPGTVDIFGDLVSQAPNPGELVDPYKTEANGDYVTDASGAKVKKTMQEISKEMTDRALPREGEILITELKYDGNPGGFGSGFDFILQSTRTTK